MAKCARLVHKEDETIEVSVSENNEKYFPENYAEGFIIVRMNDWNKEQCYKYGYYVFYSVFAELNIVNAEF